jgi:hypothetical protein
MDHNIHPICIQAINSKRNLLKNHHIIKIFNMLKITISPLLMIQVKIYFNLVID